MSTSTLVVVESPTKARTIGRFLGAGVTVLASQGHVRDLPERSLGVDLQHDFTPDYELTANGKKKVAELTKAAKSATEVYLATDPDREGEAIAWHLQEVLKHSTKAPFHRITFHEITQSAINSSFQHPGTIAMDMVDAQQARRVLDRIVGYQVSPLLWHSIQKGTSAGRVQTVALRLVVEREREIQAFVPQEYWNLDAVFETLNPQASFKARLARINGEKVLISNGPDAGSLAQALQSAGVTHRVTKVTSTPRRKNPPPPFITSTLQQAAGSALRLGASQTMRIAQELYEGVNLGGGQVGLITYMRTDSVNIAKEAQAMALDYIKTTYGPQFVPERPNVYHSRKTAQEAHEAIRPTSLQYPPDSIKQYLSPQQLKVYTLIWNRFLASQMAPAQQMDHLIEVTSQGGELADMDPNGLVAPKDNGQKVLFNKPGAECQFRAAARETLFPGFLRVYAFREVGEEADPDEAINTLPKLPLGTFCKLLKLDSEQCFTQPPSRYSEASLVKALEQNGVGRPSTYATTVNTIQERDYVRKDKSSLIPTDLGFRTCDFLIQQMPQLFDVGFTAQMEDELDNVEEGKLDWVAMLKDFYQKFQGWMGVRSMAAGSADAALMAKLLACFPADFPFDPPKKNGAITIDDKKFITSITKRVNDNGDLSERQWNAFFKMAAKYAGTHPEILTVMDSNGKGDEVRAVMAEIKAKEELPKVEASPESLALLKAMEGIQFKPATKVGKKTYDDAKFVKSFREQANGGKALSERQLQVLLQLASHYAAEIPGYAELVNALRASIGMEPLAEPGSGDSTAPDPDAKAKIEKLLLMTKEIKEWKAPSGTGRRAFDDRTFVESVSSQYTQKGSLSDRQIAALAKVLGKYKDQIADFDERTKDCQVAKPKAQLLDECCPLCGSKLVVRYFRGRSFIGCSGYPKCNYIKKKQ